jgi:hypothetical protein
MPKKEEELMPLDKLEAYKIAIDTRNLEIKLFWQRSLFFAAFISAIFVGYSSTETDPFSKLMLSSLGFLLSFAWVLANRGSKYWYESWETKIGEIEEGYDSKLFGPWKKPQDKFFLYKARLYSVSKIAIYVTDLIFIGWVIILVKEAISFFQLPVNIEANSCTAFVVYIGFLLIAIYLLVRKTKTTVPKEASDEW